jgi:hypothetical protein
MELAPETVESAGTIAGEIGGATRQMDPKAGTFWDKCLCRIGKKPAGMAGSCWHGFRFHR